MKTKPQLFTDPYLVFSVDLAKHDGATFMSDDAYGHLCTVTGATWGSQGRTFDGINDIINAGRDGLLSNIQSPVSFEAWVYSNAYETSYMMALTKVGCLELRLNGVTGKPEFVVNDLGTALYPTALVNSTWNHLVGTYNLVNIGISVNGGAPTSAAFSTAVSENSTANVIIGGRPTTYMWVGIIGEVRIYNRVLTQSEIQYNYQATKWRYR